MSGPGDTTAPLPALQGDHLEESEFLEFSNNTLSNERRKAAMRHLDSCQRCREVLGALHKPDAEFDTGPTRLKDPFVGTMLGEYRVDEPLSRGGMGAVYRGEQPVIGKKVAIKVLVPEVANDPQQMHRLLAEARAVNAIRHPNIIDIFSFGELPGGKHYFVMELLEGQALNDLFRDRNGKFTQGEVVTILEQTMSALGAAHAANVVHRDLKLANLFVSTLPNKTWHVTVLDFGLAKTLDARAGPQSAANLVMGTPGYMAPEQIMGEAVTAKADLYAMGVVAWLLLTGKEPFTAKSQVDLMVKHLEAPLPSLARLVPDCPLPLVSLIERLLAKRPEHRPPSALEVQSELKRIRKEMAGRDTLKNSVQLDESPALGSGDALPTMPVDVRTLSHDAEAVRRKQLPTVPQGAQARTPRRGRVHGEPSGEPPDRDAIETDPERGAVEAKESEPRTTDRAAVATRESSPRTEPARPGVLARSGESSRPGVVPQVSAPRATEPARPHELPAASPAPSALTPFFAGLGFVLAVSALAWVVWRYWGH